MSDLCAVLLAAGAGTRLRPLTETVPKALCPVGNVSLLDLALERLAALGFAGPRMVAVNAWYLADQVVDAVAGRAHLSVEPPPGPLGTAGALGALRDWINGRGVLVGNADAYLTGDPASADLAPLLAGWDGSRTRLLGLPGPPDEFSGRQFAGYSLLPWSRVRDLPAEPAHLVHRIWRPAQAAGELDIIEYSGGYLDTGTPANYLTANLHAAGPAGLIVASDATVTATVRHAVIGSGAEVYGPVRESVVWPGGYVGPAESLHRVIRYGRSGTIPVPAPS